MSLINITKFDFSQNSDAVVVPSDTLNGADTKAIKAVIANETSVGVLHVALKSPVPWLDVYPVEFALGPGSVQSIVVTLLPEHNRGGVLTPVKLRLAGQFLRVNPLETGDLPDTITLDIPVLPPVAVCPTCGTSLPDDARECRRCGERIRLCPICATPNTWIVRQCRRNASHVIRTQTDWCAAPGGNEAHSMMGAVSLGVHLARKWSSPSFPPSRTEDTLEWCSPVAAFGLIAAAAIDTASARSFMQAWDIMTGTPLWDLDLPDPRGLYPDRAAPVISEDGIIYTASIGGQVTAIDAIRGTLKWSIKVDGVVYGGCILADGYVIVAADRSIYVLKREDGAVERRIDLSIRVDCAPAVAGGTIYIACDDGRFYAYRLSDGYLLWMYQCVGGFDASPLVFEKVVYTATMSGLVYAFKAENGEVLWQTKVSTKGIAVTPALSSDHLLYVAAEDGNIHIVAANSGNLIRSRRLTSTPLHCSPVCGGQIVYAGADDGSIYTIDADYNVQLAYETTPGARIAGAGIALYGDLICFTATNGLLYVLQATS